MGRGGGLGISRSGWGDGPSCPDCLEATERVPCAPAWSVSDLTASFHPMDWNGSLELGPEEWQAVAAVGTLVVAAIAAVVALAQVNEAARLRRDQSRPYIVVYLERVAPTILDLVVKNFGVTAARGIRLRWDRPVTMRWEHEPQPLELFDELPLLVPGQEWRTVWDVNGRRIDDKESSYVVEVSSTDSRGRRLPDESFTLGTAQFEHAMMWDRNGLHEIGESLKKIERTVSRWGDGLDGLKVYSRDGDAKDLRQQERREARQGPAVISQPKTTASATKARRRKR